MSTTPRWQYDEMKQVGIDYSDLAEVERYDARHSRFRDVDKINESNTLAVQKQHVVMDLGAGTGAFAIKAAQQCQKVYAVDVSRIMLDVARRKAQAEALANITFCHGGFLTYAHADDPVDFIVTSIALHHLPDFWKAVALRRINGMLKQGGRLFLSDVVFAAENYEANISRWLATLADLGGRELAAEVEMHIREEYSTLTWIMEGLLARAAFRIDDMEYQEGVWATYVCTKTADCA